MTDDAIDVFDVQLRVVMPPGGCATRVIHTEAVVVEDPWRSRDSRGSFVHRMNADDGVCNGAKSLRYEICFQCFNVIFCTHHH